MNTKTLIIVGFCLLSLWTGEFQANNPEMTKIFQQAKDVPNGFEEIVLQGSLVFSPGSNPIEAGFNDNSIYIQFNQNFGNVTVTVYNPNDLIIYIGVVNTAVQQLLVIPVTFSSEGTYTIVLENATGYADGDFDKQL